MDWLLGSLTLLLGLYMAWNIGANDVANAMGTSVGSKALTLKKAVWLAAVLEFSGAFFFGSHVSETIQKGIIDSSVFSSDPALFILGMMGALLSTSILLQFASYKGLPISTTHALVGAVTGFGLIIGGAEAIFWSKISSIAASWIISPLLSGIISYAIFGFIQKKILYAESPILAMQRVLPSIVFACFFLIFISLFYNGIPQFGIKFSSLSLLSLSSTTGLVAFFFSHRSLQKSPLSAPAVGFHPTAHVEVEKSFVFLQIVSASLIAFAHGANDVSNAIGPVAAVITALKTHSLAAHTQIPSWLLALGGAGIVIGLATWGWRVIETIGEKITLLTPSRGFSAEFGAAITVLFASKLGLPISSTHALVGAVLGVGLNRGLEALNLKMVKGIAVSWIVTIPLCGVTSILCFYLLKGLYSLIQ